MSDAHEKAVEAAAIELRRITLGYCKPWGEEAESVKEVWRSRARAAIAAYEAEMWRPIEECPDGGDDEILVAGGIWEKPQTAYPDRQWWLEHPDRAPTIFRPIPLPTPPEVKG